MTADGVNGDTCYGHSTAHTYLLDYFLRLTARSADDDVIASVTSARRGEGEAISSLRASEDKGAMRS